MALQAFYIELRLRQILNRALLTSV